jgi:hypothetical protein
MKVHIRLAGTYICKLCCLTYTAYEGNVNVFIRNNKASQFSTLGSNTLSTTDVNNNAILGKPPWRILFFGTDDFSLASLKMLFIEL